MAAGGDLKLAFTNGYTGNAGATFDLLQFGSEIGAFSQTNLPTLGTGLSWNTSQLYTSGEISIAGVPEPGTWALLAVGISAIAMQRRKR